MLTVGVILYVERLSSDGFDRIIVKFCADERFAVEERFAKIGKFIKISAISQLGYICTFCSTKSGKYQKDAGNMEKRFVELRDQFSKFGLGQVSREGERAEDQGSLRRHQQAQRADYRDQSGLGCNFTCHDPDHRYPGRSHPSCCSIHHGLP